MRSAPPGATHGVSASRALALALASATAAGASAASRGGHRAREVAVRPSPPGLPAASASSRSSSWRRRVAEVTEERVPAAAARELGGLGVRRLRVLRWSPAGRGSSGVVLKIGTVVSLKSSASVGKDLLRGYALYFELLSREGDVVVYGEPWAVELYVCSGDFDAERTGAAFRYLRTAYGIGLFLGPYSSALTLAAAKVTQETGALLLAPGASDPEIYAGRNRVFGTLPAARKYIVPAIDALAERGARTLSYVWEDSSGSKATCADVPELSRTRGLVLLSGVMVAEHNVSDAVRQLAQEDPDVVVGCVYRRLCIALLREAYEQDLNPRAFLFSLCTTTPNVLGATDNLARYALGVVPQVPIERILPNSPHLTFQDFALHWQDFHQTDTVPTYHAISAFVSCAVLVRAAVRSGYTHPGVLAGVLRSLQGSAFDADGQSLYPTAVVQFRGFDPHLTIVAPPAWANHSLAYPRPRWRDWICYDPDAPHAHAGFLADPSRRDAACEDCPAGKKSEFDPGLGWRVCKECSPGSIVVTKEANGARTTACYPCVRGMMNVRVGGSWHCKLCPRGRFQDQEGQTACNDCPAGRFSSSAGATICASCTGFPGLGTFYNTESGSTTCYRCPVGGLCEPDAQGLHSSVTNEADYYMLPGAGAGGQARMYRCSHGQGRACLSRGRCYQDLETGETAMEGIMCGRCVEGFARLDSQYGLCKSCEGVGMAMLGLLLNAFLGACLMGAVLLITFNTDFSRPLQIHSVILRQFMNYVQMAVVVTERLSPDLLLVDVNAILNYLSFFTSISTFSDFSLQCFAWSTAPSLKFHHVEHFVGLVAVPLVLLLLGGVWRLVRWAAFTNGWPQPSWRRLVTAAIVTLFSMLSPVTERSLASWKCHHFDVLRLASDPSEECQAPSHRAWQLAGGIGLIAFSLGIPLVLYHLLRHYHRGGRLPDQKASQMIGFLTSGFEPQFWYFECVFMLRKVLFHFIVVVPNIFADSAEKIRIIQNTALFVLSSSFFFLHLLYQPYDNRCHYILDKIETASLLAIMMTPLLQRLSWGMDKTFLFEGKDWYQRPRDALCFTLLAALHGRVLLIMLWGLARGAIQRFLRKSIGERSCLRRSSRLLVSSGEAYVRPSGFALSGVKGEAENLLCDMVWSVVRLHIRQGDALDFEGMAASLQRVAVEALNMRYMEAFEMENPVLFYFRRVRKRAQKMRVGREALLAVLARVEAYLRKRGWKMSLRSNQLSPRSAEHGISVALGSPGLEFARTRSLSPFNEASVMKTCGKVFTAEELHGAMMRLGTDAYQQVCPIQSLLFEDDFGGESRTTNLTDASTGPSKTTVASGASKSIFNNIKTTVMSGDSKSSIKTTVTKATVLRKVCVDERLSLRQLLVSELRAAREENQRTMADLEGRRQDSQRLLEALRNSGEQAPAASNKASRIQHRASAADEDTAVASEHVILEDYVVGVESCVQPTRTAVVPRISARPSPAAIEAGLRPSELGSAIAEASPGREGHTVTFRPASASLGGAKTGRPPVVPPLKLAAVAAGSQAQARPAASLARKAQEKYLLPVQPEGSTWSPSAAKKVSMPADAPDKRSVTIVLPVEDPATPEDGADSPSARPTLSARRRRAGSIQRKRLVEELEGLTRERDAALEQIDNDRIEVEGLLIKISTAQRELTARAQRAQEAERRLATLEADSARLRRWAEAVPCAEARVEDFCGDLLHTLRGENSSKEEVPKGEPEAPPGRSALRSPRTRTSPRAAGRSK